MRMVSFAGVVYIKLGLKDPFTLTGLRDKKQEYMFRASCFSRSRNNLGSFLDEEFLSDVTFF